MFGILAGALGVSQTNEREVFLRRRLPLPDDLMTPVERIHRFHEEQFQRMFKDATAQGYTVKGYRGDANGGELIVERAKQ